MSSEMVVLVSSIVVAICSMLGVLGSGAVTRWVEGMASKDKGRQDELANYRKSLADRVQVLEDRLDEQQEEINNWRDKYHKLERELGDENNTLKARVRDLEQRLAKYEQSNGKE